MGHPIPGTVGSRMRIRIFHPQPLGSCRRVEFGIRRDQHQCLVPGMHVQRHRQLYGVVAPHRVRISELRGTLQQGDR